ncbi:MAG: nucleotidyltransferase family protein [Salinibacter sp.]
MPSVSKDELERYRATCRKRDDEARRRQTQAHRDARTAARRAAAILRAEFGVGRVVLFGSVAREAFLGPRSDIDLAVEGLSARDHARAVDRVQEASEEWRVDLVRIEQCSSSLKTDLSADGIEL